MMKYYNHTPQDRAKRPYQFVHIDLIGLIILMEYGVKRYFFMFTNNNIRITESYTNR